MPQALGHSVSKGMRHLDVLDGARVDEALVTKIVLVGGLLIRLVDVQQRDVVTCQQQEWSIRSSTRGTHTHSVGAQVRTFDGVEAPVRELSLLLLITTRHEEDGLSRKHRHDDQDLLCATEFLFF